MERVRVLFGGDLMLGRLVGDEIRRRGPVYPVDAIASLMRGADLTVVNLECAITDSTRVWSGEPKAFYFGAPSPAAHTLRHAGVDLVSLANNHVLDFDFGGLSDTLEALRGAGIAFAGAGANADEARRAAIVERKGVRFGMVAYCDHQEDFAATADRPGIAFVDLDDEAGALRLFREDLERMRAARVDWPILSLHWGPNMVEAPSARFVRIAHAAIDAGYRVLFGHSAHVFHGVELRDGFPILYAAGDLVDDYYIDPQFRNDHQLLFEIESTGRAVRRVDLHPVYLHCCHTALAEGEAFEFIAQRATRLCAQLGSEVKRDGARLWIDAREAPGA